MELFAIISDKGPAPLPVWRSSRFPFLQGQTHVIPPQKNNNNATSQHQAALIAPKVKKTHRGRPREKAEAVKRPTTVSHMCSITLNIGGKMHIPLPIHLVWSALSLAQISSHLQYLWIIQNDAFAIDFIRPW